MSDIREQIRMRLEASKAAGTHVSADEMQRQWEARVKAAMPISVEHADCNSRSDAEPTELDLALERAKELLK